MDNKLFIEDALRISLSENPLTEQGKCINKIFLILDDIRGIYFFNIDSEFIEEISINAFSLFDKILLDKSLTFDKADIEKFYYSGKVDSPIAIALESLFNDLNNRSICDIQDFDFECVENIFNKCVKSILHSQLVLSQNEGLDLNIEGETTIKDSFKDNKDVIINIY